MKPSPFRLNRMFVPALAAAGLLAVASVRGAEAPDAFMGDWSGELVKADGTKTPLAAQVIALGDNLYHANLLERFDTRDLKLAEWEGRLDADAVTFGRDGTIADGAFTGTLAGKTAGRFTLEPVTRLSPTLGAKPPAGAVVLLDGTNLDAWETTRRSVNWATDLAKLIGGENRVAYLTNRVFVPQAGDVVLGVGSDDGVKVWVNGRLVHTNNVPRGLIPGQDKITVPFVQGWNTILAKVGQGGGDWAFCLQVTGTDGTVPNGLKAELLPKDAGGAPDGAIVAWKVAGPYSQQDMDWVNQMDVAFAPEKQGEEVPWNEVTPTVAPLGPAWRLVGDGSMEVVGGTGSLYTRQRFGSHRMHIEFMPPFMPSARGQGRGNSGVYVQGRYEIQVLDSYGLEGVDNECGGIYRISAPRVNMCAPPAQWQTYDITFTAPTFDAQGNKTADGRVTVFHNGTAIHEDLALPGVTGGAMDGNVAEPGPLLLQDHGNPVRFRNIWIEEL